MTNSTSAGYAAARLRARIAGECHLLLQHRAFLLRRKSCAARFYTEDDARRLVVIARGIRLRQFQLYLLGGPPLHGKAGFNPDQLRVPAGNPDGGQWTGDNGARPPSSDSSVLDGRILLAGDISGFTKHGINQTINRGVSPATIQDAVINPLQIQPQSNGSIRYVGRGAVVVLNPAGQVVTAWPR